jgi:hypothetical protein
VDHIRPKTTGIELGPVVADFRGAAREGQARRFDGRPYSRAELGELRSALNYVDSELGAIGIEALRTQRVQSLIDELREAGLPERRLSAIVDALRTIFAFAVGRGLLLAYPSAARDPLLDPVMDVGKASNGATADGPAAPGESEFFPADGFLVLAERARKLAQRTAAIQDEQSNGAAADGPPTLEVTREFVPLDSFRKPAIQEPEALPDEERPTPTHAVLALVTRTVTWIVWSTVIAFALVGAALVVEFV